MVQNADLPKDVSSLIARLDLNGMTFVCKRCEGMNREIHGQVTRDISYLVEQIDDLHACDDSGQGPC